MKNKIILASAIISVAFVLILFVFHFYLNLNFVISDDPEDWAQFGDYYGGILNPVLSFFAIILLIKSIDMQILANNVLKEDLEENKKNEKLRNFESLFFNMLDRQNNLLPLVFVELNDSGGKKRINGVDVFRNLEEIVFDLLDRELSGEDITKQINDYDTHEVIYSQFRCFYLCVSFISEYISEAKGFSKEDRIKYYKALINFTDFSQIKIMCMFLQFMTNEYGNVKKLSENKEFEEVLLSLGLSFDIYK